MGFVIFVVLCGWVGTGAWMMGGLLRRERGGGGGNWGGGIGEGEGGHGKMGRGVDVSFE